VHLVDFYYKNVIIFLNLHKFIYNFTDRRLVDYNCWN